MANKKQYAEVEFYENKLSKVMERNNVTNYDFNWSRKDAYVSFIYKGQYYRFEHDVEKANALGKMRLVYGSDVFAQIVLALEDLARMVERGIYDLSTWCAGMKALPSKKALAQCLIDFGIEPYAETPTQDELSSMYRERAKSLHPDYNNGDDVKFKELTALYNQCVLEIGGNVHGTP